MSIRFAQEKDLNDIKNLLMQVNNVHADGRPDFFIKNCRKYTDDEILEQIRNDSILIFVYPDEKDNVIGYAFCQIKNYEGINNVHPHKTLYIDDLCVDENHRRKHIGEALLKHVEQFAKENNFYNIELNVWECNPSAKAFYEKMGMQVLKTGMEKLL